MAETQEVDVQQVMARIRDHLRRQRSSEGGPASPSAAPGDDSGPLALDVANLQLIGDLRKVSFTSHRWLLGSLILAVKKVLVKLLTPVLERQTAYNMASARSTADVGAWVQTLESRQAHALQRAVEHLAALERDHGRLQAEVAELRTRLGADVARVKEEVLAGVRGDLFARVAEEIRARDAALRQDVREDVLARDARLREEIHASDLRQEVTAQWQAIEGARQANATLRERASASERRWRRVLHALQPERSPEAPAEAAPPVETPRPLLSDLEPEFDYAGFEERFRGAEDDIKERQRIYLPYFQGARHVVVDIGCGRGEFLELLRDHGIDARGVDLDLDMVLLCRDKALDVVREDVFAHLGALADDTVGGIFGAQLVEHLPPRRVIELVKLCHRKLAPGGFLVLETPNPACLMVFADSFYRDLSHLQPIHPDTLRFVLEATHFHPVELKTLAPVDPSMRVPPLAGHDPALAPFNQGIDRVNALLFGFQDYAVIGQKRGPHAGELASAPPGPAS